MKVFSRIETFEKERITNELWGLLIGLYSLNGLPLVGVHGLVMVVASYAYVIEFEAIVLDRRVKVPGHVLGILSCDWIQINCFGSFVILYAFFTKLLLKNYLLVL